jgi:predicted Zn-dependent protease
MQGALAHLQEVLAKEGQPPASGAVLAAAQWRATGRPDLARKELAESGFRGPPATQLVALLMTADLAFADEDWPAAQRALEDIAKVQPDLPQLPVWRAALAAARGDPDGAREIYKDLVKKDPASGVGYLGLADVAEKAQIHRVSSAPR